MISRGKIYLFDSIGFLVLYVVYISVVIIGRIINQKIRQKQQQVDEAALIDNNVTGMYIRNLITQITIDNLINNFYTYKKILSIYISFLMRYPSLIYFKWCTLIFSHWRGSRCSQHHFCSSDYGSQLSILGWSYDTIH